MEEEDRIETIEKASGEGEVELDSQPLWWTLNLRAARLEHTPFAICEAGCRESGMCGRRAPRRAGGRGRRRLKTLLISSF